MTDKPDCRLTDEDIAFLDAWIKSSEAIEAEFRDMERKGKRKAKVVRRVGGNIWQDMEKK